MAAVINTNYLSLVAQNNLNKSQSSLGNAIEAPVFGPAHQQRQGRRCWSSDC